MAWKPWYFYWGTCGLGERRTMSDILLTKAERLAATQQWLDNNDGPLSTVIEQALLRKVVEWMEGQIVRGKMIRQFYLISKFDMQELRKAAGLEE